MTTLSCHCHSCVASARFIDDKQLGGTSIIKDHGVHQVVYMANDIEFSSPNLSDTTSMDLVGFVKVGPLGKVLRVYTKCCGTAIGHLEPKFAFLNANCIFEADGSKWLAPNVIPNIMASHAFDKEVIPEPKYGMAPFSLIVQFLPVFGALLNPFATKFPTSHDALFCDKKLMPEDKVEVVPVTWE